MTLSLEAGNYVDAARHDPVEWRRTAARAMLGIEHGVTLATLESTPAPEAQFFAAAAHWMRGDESKALALLASVALPQARRLAALIRQPQIHVLAQLPWTRSGPQDLLSAARRDRKFVVRNISFHPDDLPNVPRADVRRFFDDGSPPDFYICQMVEWHVLPPNLGELTCPRFGQTSDYDMHIHAVEPWLHRFDEIVVLDPDEWTRVRGLVGDVPISTYPKSFGVSETLPPVPQRARDIDLFQSGTLRHPFNPDKAALAAAVLGIPGIDVLMVNGFLGPDDYVALLGRSKTTYTFVRRPASTPTRGLESLAMGCTTLVQAGSVLDLWAGPGEGLVAYDNTPAGLASSLAAVLAESPLWSGRASRGAARIRHEFALTRVASQFLRYLTVRCALMEPARSQGGRHAHAALDQRRPIVWKGWLPGRASQQAVSEAAIDHWERRRAESETAALVNLLAREHLLAHADEARRHAALEGNPWESADLDAALALYREGIAKYPDDLALHFNFVRAALHFGNAGACEHGLAVARRILDTAPAAWRIGRTDDLLTWDFFPGYFDFRQCIDLVAYGARADVAPALTRIVQAATHYYLANFEDRRQHLAAAVALNPGFASYRFANAVSLTADAASRDEALAILSDLARDSVVFVEARQWLAAMNRSPETHDLLRRAQTAIAEIEPPLDDPLPFARVPRIERPDHVTLSASAWVRVLEITSASRRSKGVLAKLGRLWLARRLRAHSRMAIFGMGPGGVAVFTRIGQVGGTAVGFIDNYVSFHGRRFLGLPVQPVARIVEDGLGATAVVLSSYSRSGEMRDELEALGCNLEIVDFHYWDGFTGTAMRRALVAGGRRAARRLASAASRWSLGVARWASGASCIRRLWPLRRRGVRVVAIFGTGARGIRCHHGCRFLGIEVRCFVDNSIDVQRRGQWLGRPVVDPAALAGAAGRGIDVVVITSLVHSEAMRAQLASLGVTIDVVVFA